MPRDMRAVFRAAEITEADVIVAWLARRGVAAYVDNPLVTGTLGFPVLFAPRGIEVCVVDPRDADRAVALLRDHHQCSGSRKKQEDSARTIEVVCEECGRRVSFPSDQSGSVQCCPHCRGHVDVPE